MAFLKENITKSALEVEFLVLRIFSNSPIEPCDDWTATYYADVHLIVPSLSIDNQCKEEWCIINYAEALDGFF